MRSFQMFLVISWAFPDRVHDVAYLVGVPVVYTGLFKSLTASYKLVLQTCTQQREIQYLP